MTVAVLVTATVAVDVSTTNVVETLVAVATVVVSVDVVVGEVTWRLHAELMTVAGYLVKTAGVDNARLLKTVTVAAEVRVTVAVVVSVTVCTEPTVAVAEVVATGIV